MPYVGPEGPRTATLAIVAEKGHNREVELGRPLVGPTGEKVDKHLLAIGLQRKDVYLTNVVKQFHQVGNPTDAEVREALPSLYRELDSLPNLNCIVAMGNVALKALSGNHYQGIGSWRGSVLKSILGTKMVPTYHPSFYMRGEWRFQPIVEFDLRRAFQESLEPDIRYRPREFYIQPESLSQAIEWLDMVSHGKYLSFDIETIRVKLPGDSHRTSFISCIGFTDDPGRAVCIPITRGNRRAYWQTWEERCIWRRIEAMFADPNKVYVAQNGLFDTWHLWRHGINVPHFGRSGFDTMYAHRLLAADLPHDLGFLVSIYTTPNEPYYKDESGSWDGQTRIPDDQYWIYNCKDVACTLEVALNEIADMQELGIYDYYIQRDQPQVAIFSKMRQKGFRVDPKALSTVRERLLDEQKAYEKQISDKIGWMPNTRSYIQMGKLYQQLGITPEYTTTGRPKCDEDTIRRYAYNHDNARDVLMSVLEVQERRTFVSGFLGLQPDSKDFYHPGYDVSKARTGRSASFGADEGGPQLQNIPKSLRNFFIPDDPNTDELTQADLKQAEAMYTAWDAQDEVLIALFKRGMQAQTPEDVIMSDYHRLNACKAYRGWSDHGILPPYDLMAAIRKVCDACARIGEKDCAHSERQLAKNAGYAFFYKMGPRKFCMMMRSQNIFIPEAEAKRIKACILPPSVIRWQERAIIEMRANRWWTNPYGRAREFYGLLDEELIRALLSHKAQSTVADDVKLAKIYLEANLPEEARLVTETHDSTAVNHPRRLRDEVTHHLRQAFNNPIKIHGRTLCIPVEISHGPNWGAQKAA